MPASSQVAPPAHARTAARPRSSKQAPHAPTPAAQRWNPPARSPGPASSARTASSCACGGGCPRCTSPAAPRSPLRIGSPGTTSEHQADKTAARLTRTSPPPSVTRPAASAPDERAPGSVERALRSSGEALSPQLRASFEPQLGQDLADVRVHTDASAAASADEIDAEAYAAGRHVVFGPGRFQPDTPSGQHLLAHELAHVTSSSDNADRLVHRQPKAEPGKCDPADLGTLGPAFQKADADVQALGLPAKNLQTTSDDDFVLYCPHASTRPLKKLLPGATVYWISDADLTGKGKGKAEVWAQQEGESGWFWGFIKKSKIVATPAPTPQPDPTPTPEPEAKGSTPAPAPEQETVTTPEEEWDAQAQSNRYGHTDNCPQTFLESHLWPGERLARHMLHHAQACLCGALYGNDSARHRRIKATLAMIFGQDWQSQAETIRGNLILLTHALESGPFTYDCVTGCDSEDNGDPTTLYGTTLLPLPWEPPLSGGGTINLCYENLLDKNLPFTGRVIIHEMGHRYLGLEDPEGDDTMSQQGINMADSYGYLAQTLWNDERIARYASTDAEFCDYGPTEEILGIDQSSVQDPSKWDK